MSADLSLLRDEPEDGPDADGLTFAQRLHVDALERLHADTDSYPRFPLEALHGLAGTLAPGELWLWIARQANGKSLAMQNIAHWLLMQKVPGLFLGTEQAPRTLRIKHACLIAGVAPRLMLKPSNEERYSREALAIREEKGPHVFKALPDEIRLTQWWKRMQDDVWAAINWLSEPQQDALLSYSTTTYVNRTVLVKEIAAAVEERGAQYVIIDHLDHMDHGGGFNATHELRQTIYAVKALAEKYRIPILAASQAKRPGDPMQHYQPPTAEDAYGSASKEQVADVIFGAWRKLRDMDPQEQREMMTQAKAGKASADSIFEKGAMGVRVLKDRLGDAPGRQCTLWVTRGRLTDVQPA